MAGNFSRAGLVRFLASAFTFGALVSHAPAQDAGTLLREQQRLLPTQGLMALPSPEAEELSGAESKSGPEAGPTVVVTGLRFVGRSEILPEAERARIIGAAVGQRLGIAGLHALADAVTIALQVEGRLLARAVLPPQDITEGVVTVEIIEGVLEDISFARGEDVRARADLLGHIAGAHIAIGDLTRRNLEEALLRMSDHPGVTARSRLVAGEAAGTSRLMVEVEQAPVLAGQVWVDNSGSANTGRVQANGSATLTDLSGYGDLTRLFATVSEGQRFGTLSTSLPLGASGFSLGVSGSALAYRNIDDTGRALGLEGGAYSVGLGLTYGLVRSRDLNIRLDAGLNWKALIDDSLAGRLQDKRVLVGSLGVSGDMRDALLGGGLTSWSLGWSLGELDLSREPSALTADQAGLMTQGNYHRLNASVTRLQNLPGDFSLFARLSGQWANKNLDSSEDFSLGGPHGVRGWPVGEGRGDMGVIGSIEVRYDMPMPQTAGGLQLAAFLDAGHVWVNANPNGVAPVNACSCNDFGLSSLGVSARWTRDNLSFSATYAHGLGANPGRAVAGGPTDNHQFWLSGAIRF